MAEVMQFFMGTDGPRTLFQLELTEQIGRDLRDFSLFPSENEILLPPNTQFEVVSRFDAGHGVDDGAVQAGWGGRRDPLFG